MTKKKIPAIIFNKTDYKYPKGLKITDEDELAEKLSSKEWNTGPVDKMRPKRKDKKPVEKVLTDKEKQDLINQYSHDLGLDVSTEVDLDTDKNDTTNDDKDPVVDTTEKEGKKEKYLSHMNLPELIQKAMDIDLAIDENWNKTELMNAIREHEKDKG